MACAPRTQRTHRFDEFLARSSKGVSHLWRRGPLDLAMDDTVRFQLAHLRRQDLFADARQ
jgi:hypothetical protein